MIRWVDVLPQYFSLALSTGNLRQMWNSSIITYSALENSIIPIRDCVPILVVLRWLLFNQLKNQPIPLKKLKKIGYQMNIVLWVHVLIHIYISNAFQNGKPWSLVRVLWTNGLGKVVGYHRYLWLHSEAKKVKKGLMELVHRFAFLFQGDF